MATTKVPAEGSSITRAWPSFTWPTWKWLDEVFRDADGPLPLRIEELVEGDTLVVRAELPGIDPDTDVEIDVEDGVLKIMARRTEREERDDRRVHRTEFRYGSFVRTIAIPMGVEESAISATYRDGVLEVRVPMPKGEQAPAHRVKVLHG
jgi:HSP20 family protein